MVEERTVTDTLRKLLVESFIEAWETTCSSTNCEKAAKAVGIAPVDREAVKSSHFVKEIPENELNSILLRNAQRNRFSINSKMITSDEMIAEISSYVSRSGDRSLCVDFDLNAYPADVLNWIDDAREHGTYSLSQIEPFKGLRI